MTVDNEPGQGETVSFIRMLERVCSVDSDEITFYAHTKGVRHEGPRLKANMLWADYMYRYNLSNIERVKKILRKYPCCGCFKRVCAPSTFPPFSKWHYVGTFFWFNHRALFSRNWRDITESRYGTEAYLSKFFSVKEAYCLFMRIRGRCKGAFGELYDMDYWNQKVFPYERIFNMSRGCLHKDLFYFLFHFDEIIKAKIDAFIRGMKKFKRPV